MSRAHLPPETASPAPSGSSGLARAADPAGDFASAKLKALRWALAALVSLFMLGVIGALIATHRESSAIAAEREQAQVRNAMASAFDEMRADLTSVTFWDEAVEETALHWDQAWAEENIGRWLHQLHGVDESYILSARGEVLQAMNDGKLRPPASFAPYRPLTDTMLGRIRSRLDSYPVGKDIAPFGSHELGAPPRFDEAELIFVSGRPLLLVVTPILPDFGHRATPPGGYAMLVVVHRLDGGFFSRLGRDLIVSGLHFSGSAAPVQDGMGRLPLTIGGTGQSMEVRWFQQARGTDLVRRSLPVVTALILVLILAGLTGSRFVRKSAQALYVSRHEALHDELTGLPNRRLLTRLVEAEMAGGAPLALMFVDLDRFKEVNDLWGHAAGDTLIREAAARLVALAGEQRVARFGGDEFVLLIPGGRTQAEAAGKSALSVLREPFLIAGHAIELAGSLGMALAPEHGRSPSELMRKADVALYRAKALGKNRLVSFDATMDAELKERQALERDLRKAIAANELTVAYQPQFARADGRMAGVEALARWRRADGQMIEPGVFVPIAEDLGLVAAIDAAILEQACRDAAGWPGITLAVNVSPGQLHSPLYAETVLAALRRGGLEPERLRLEITESALIGHMGQVAQTVAELRRHGVRIALDDFGTGFSSLERLRMLKLDGMKIDKGFVADLGRNPDAPALITSMVALGHALGLSITAEGVETEDQLALLQMAGCDEFQGNLLGLPMPAGKIAPLLGADYRKRARA